MAGAECYYFEREWLILANHIGSRTTKKSLVVGFAIVSIVTGFLPTDNYSSYCCHYRCQCALPLVYVAYHRETATVILMNLT